MTVRENFEIFAAAAEPILPGTFCKKAVERAIREPGYGVRHTGVKNPDSSRLTSFVTLYVS